MAVQSDQDITEVCGDKVLSDQELNWREPAGRDDHSTAIVDSELFLWAGHQDGIQDSSVVEIFDVNTGNWGQYTTHGSPPLGVQGYSCVAVKDELYYFGGRSGIDDGSYHNSVYTLSTSNLQWKMLAPSTTDDGAPMQKWHSGMVHFVDEEEDLLYVIGGWGSAAPSSPQLGAKYYRLPSGSVYTNEQHVFSLSTNEWSSVTVTGQIPPPCSLFTLAAQGDKRAAMFAGGTEPGSLSNDLFIVELGKHSVNWSVIRKPVSQPVEWPGRRFAYAATHITGSLFVMIGGANGGGSVLSDMWFCDTTINRWKKLPKLPRTVTKRWSHSMSAFHLEANCVWILVFGGSPSTADTSIIELIRDNEGEWSVGRVMEKDTLMYIEYQEILREGKLNRVSSLEQEVQQLQQQLQQREQSLTFSQRRIREVEEEVRVLSETLQVKKVQDQSLQNDVVNVTNVEEDKTQDVDQYNERKDDLQITTQDVLQAYSDDLSERKKREEKLKKELEVVLSDCKEKDQQCSNLKDDLIDMQKEMAVCRDECEQKLMEKLQQEIITTAAQAKVDAEVQVGNYFSETKLIASEEKNQQLLKELEQTKKMSRVRDLRIAKLEENSEQLMQEKSIRHTVEAAVQADYLAVAPDFLRGVEVYRETVLEVVGNKSQKVEWPGYGFFIEVPKGAVPPGVTISVGVKVILAGQFKFPENRQLISAIYWVSSSMEFLEEVAVNIQHCAIVRNEDECSQFKFIIAKCSQNKLPYTFREREGSFNSHTQYGAIKLKQFSLLGETAPEDTDNLCTAFMFYQQLMTSPLTVEFHFVVVRDLQPNLQEVKEQYEKWRADRTTLEICIEDDPSPAIRLDQKKQEVGQWKILPLSSPTQITKTAIKNYQIGRRIPHCGFELQLQVSENSESSEVQLLRHEVTVTGVSTLTTFHMRYPQNEEHQKPPVPQALAVSQIPIVPQSPLTSAEPQTSNGKSAVYSQPPKTSNLMILVAKKIPTKWYEIGVMLEIEAATLDSLETQNKDQVRLVMKVFDHWKQEQKVPYTWDTIISSLEEIDEKDTATNIRKCLDNE